VEIHARRCQQGFGAAGTGILRRQPGEIMACGDSPNDAAMLREAGLAAAANAGTVILAMADFISGSSNDDLPVLWTQVRSVSVPLFVSFVFLVHIAPL
jgi:hydroxymethylpyrimidine pyrophosphatase-like HAD family hydrolase